MKQIALADAVRADHYGMVGELELEVLEVPEILDCDAANAHACASAR
jgi:hypothetical protein